MDLEQTRWLNEEFLKNALEDGDGSKGIEIINFESKRAVPKGNNYMCDLFRVSVSYKIKNTDEKFSKSLIIKVPITGGLNNYLMDFGIVQKEVLVYKEFLPKLCKLFSDKNEELLTPKSYISSEDNVIVMEDLNSDGFKMVDRLQQLDYEHTVIALVNLAKFHAASVKLQEENPELIDVTGKELMFRRDTEKMMQDILGKCPMELLGIEFSTWPESKEYIDSINCLLDVTYEKLTDCIERKEDEFNVLNHGDFWLTNMLYKYDDEGTPIKVKFIDLQLTRFASPAIDLIYLFNGSVQEDIRVNKYEELINIYVEALNKNLENFDCKKRVKASEIFEAVDKRKFYAFYANITLLPVVVQDTKTIMEIKEMTENDIHDLANNPFRKYMQTDNFKRLFSKRIREFSTVLKTDN